MVTPQIIDPATADGTTPPLPKEPITPLDPKKFDNHVPTGGMQ
jgi:hypothetical protein